jgi:CheY-like chemotaxis protein
MKKILIVDDQADVLEILNEYFQMKGYHTLPALEGRTGLELYERENPAAAIIDIEMPVMNGIELTRQILSRKADFPIIIITAFIEKYSQTELLELGAKRIMMKPLNLLALGQEIEKIIHT